MAKFCSQCGKPLAEGEICSCQLQQTENAQTQQAQTGNGQTQQNAQSEFVSQAGQQFNQTFEKAAGATKVLFGKILPILKNPVEEFKKLIAEKDVSLAIQMIIFNIIVSFVALVIAMITVRAKLGDASEYVQIPYVKVVITGTLAVAINYFATSGILFGFTRVFSKGTETTFSQSITAVGGMALYDIAVLILSVVCMFINTGFGLFIMLAGYGFTYLLMVVTYCEAVTLQSSAKLYVLAITKVCMLLVMYFVCRILFSQVLQSVLGGSISSILDGLGSLGSYSDWY